MNSNNKLTRFSPNWFGVGLGFFVIQFFTIITLGLGTIPYPTDKIPKEQFVVFPGTSFNFVIVGCVLLSTYIGGIASTLIGKNWLANSYFLGSIELLLAIIIFINIEGEKPWACYVTGGLIVPIAILGGYTFGHRLKHSNNW